MDVGYTGSLKPEKDALLRSLRTSVERDMGVWEGKAKIKGHTLEGKDITWGPERVEEIHDPDGTVTITVRREMRVKDKSPLPIETPPTPL